MANRIFDRYWRGASTLTLAIGISAVIGVGAVAAKHFGEWSLPASAEQPGTDPSLNTAFNDGCPILSPDGLSLYMATNRNGNLDIWAAHRPNTRSGFGPPQRLPEPVNSAAPDFCPTPVRGRGLFFVSKRTEPNGDIYFTRQRRDGSWEDPIHLGPNINSNQEEWSPAFFHDDQNRPVLYFSRTAPGTNQHDIYESVAWGPARPVLGEVNSPASDARPNVSKDGREIVWDANRGTATQDIWTATRASTNHPWSGARRLAHLSSDVAQDTRASLSWDGTFLLFGSNRPGSEGPAPGTTALQADIYVSTRDKLRGRDR